MQRKTWIALCLIVGLSACGNSHSSDEGPSSSTPVTFVDPGAAPWELVPREELAERCGLDPELLDAADVALNRPYGVVRRGLLCHEFYPDGADQPTEVWSTTKTLGALVTGIAVYQTRDLPAASGRKTGPLNDTDRADHWLDSFTFNPDAQVAHVLAMLAHNEDLSFGNREHAYDLTGSVQINRLSDVIRTAIAQDPQRFGNDLEEFTQRFLFDPLGIENSTWSNGAPDKVFGASWHSTVRDMARVGLLMLHNGVWSGKRLVGEDWIYKMTHPSFEDANTGYGYLTWLNSASNYAFGQAGGRKQQGALDPCSPRAINAMYPHGISEATDCYYAAPYTCEQEFDVGMFFAAGLFGQYIVGHRGLDLVLVIKNGSGGPAQLWAQVRPALVALDPVYQGDEEAFCADYGSNSYAPDLP